MANASDALNGLVSLLEGALGASETPATKTRLHAVASVLGSLGDEFAPLLEKTFDVSALCDAIQRLENGITETEGGVRDLLAVIEHKTPDATTTPVNHLG